MSFEAHTINKSTPVPLYFQLKQIILDEINSGSLSPGDIIPTELEFAQLYDISRTTIRQAVTELVSDGYLYRQKGKGTFVAKPKINQDFIQKIETFNDEMKQKGLQPSTKVITLQKEEADSTTAQILQLKKDDAVITLNRLRYADGEPIVYVETSLPYKLCKAVLDFNMEKESLYDILSRSEEIKVHRVIRTIEAKSARKAEADYLRIQTGDPVQYIEFIAYNKYNVPVEYSRSYYRGDKNKFTVELIL